MRIDVHTYYGKGIQKDLRLTIDPMSSVLAAKILIQDTLGEDLFPCSQQIICHRGKILDDDTTLHQNKVTEESGGLIVMLAKGKFPRVTSPREDNNGNMPDLVPDLVPDLNMMPDLVSDCRVLPSHCPRTPPRTASHASTSSSSGAGPSNAPSPIAFNSANPRCQSIAASSELDIGFVLDYSVLDQLLALGDGAWNRITVFRALRAAHGNPERAVEYIFNGLPEPVEDFAPILAGPTRGPIQLALADVTQFLSVPIQSASVPAQEPTLIQSASVPAQEPEPSPGSLAELSFEQREILDGFVAMGFNRDLATQAFLACGRNDELALKYLLERAGDGAGDQQ